MYDASASFETHGKCCLSLTCVFGTCVSAAARVNWVSSTPWLLPRPSNPLLAPSPSRPARLRWSGPSPWHLTESLKGEKTTSLIETKSKPFEIHLGVRQVAWKDILFSPSFSCELHIRSPCPQPPQPVSLPCVEGPEEICFFGKRHSYNVTGHWHWFLEP